MKLEHSRKRYDSLLMMTIVICLSMICAIVIPWGNMTADAQTARVAIVTSVKGDVTVKKAGGVKSYEVYKDMSLNQGDYLSVGADSSVVLQIGDDDAEITLGEHSEVALSDLSSKDDGKKSGIKLWAGSLWAKVKSLVGSDDSFVIETPTSVMGVRGTQFFVGIDPNTGDSNISVFAGIVNALAMTRGTEGNDNSTPPDEERDLFIYPGQMGMFIDRGDDGVAGYPVPSNIEALLQNASADVINALLRSFGEIQQENDDFIARMLEEIERGAMSDEEAADLLGLDSAADFERKINMLLANIVRNAMAKSEIDEDGLSNLIDEINKTANRPLDLDDAGHLPLTDKEKQQQEVLQQALEERQKKLDEAAARQDRMKQQQEDLVKKLQEQREKTERENQERAEAARKAAEERYREALNERQREQFDKDRAQREQERQQSNPATSRPETPPSNGGSGNPPPVTPPVTNKRVELVVADTDKDLMNLDIGEEFTVNLVMKDFKGTNNIYAMQIHLLYDMSIFIPNEPNEGNEDNYGLVLDPHNIVFPQEDGKVVVTKDCGELVDFDHDNLLCETLAVVTLFGDAIPASISENEILLGIANFMVEGGVGEKGTISLVILIVDKSGNIIYEGNRESVLTFQMASIDEQP